MKIEDIEEMEKGLKEIKRRTITNFIGRGDNVIVTGNKDDEQKVIKLLVRVKSLCEQAATEVEDQARRFFYTDVEKNTISYYEEQITKIGKIKFFSIYGGF